MKMTERQCREAFARGRVLRLGTVDSGGQPHLVPATYALAGDAVVIAVDHKPKSTSNLKRLRNVAENPAVTLLVDHYDDDWDQLWWVRADGEAEVLESEHAQELVDPLVDKYVQYRAHRPAGPVIKIRVNRWSGWGARQD
ncbi:MULTISPECIES: TIGR03668 family PPOX class F420-dependent oxidoreductase [Streptomyces]|uniref:TIGR03668 family PPOX class F420-dependent oxidoreductase n=1 Tax=Streptomyces TaxID=1883 RepID=UPI00365BCC8C